MMTSGAMLPPLGWLGIARLGLVQSAIGAIVMLATSLLNRVMVVEYAQAAALPAGLVAFHYAVQLSRPKWGHGSDSGWRRTPWIIGGMAVLALGGVLATQATIMLADRHDLALGLSVLAYAMIGGGVGAAGTSLLALLATRTAPARRPAAASLTWIMMILGIVIYYTSVRLWCPAAEREPRAQKLRPPSRAPSASAMMRPWYFLPLRSK